MVANNVHRFVACVLLLTPNVISQIEISSPEAAKLTTGHKYQEVNLEINETDEFEITQPEIVNNMSCPEGLPLLGSDGNVLQCEANNTCSHGFTCNDGICCPRTECPDDWTQWFDRDNPSGTGDWEMLTDLISQYPNSALCPRPYALEVQTLDDNPASSTGDIFSQYSPLVGFVCRNSQQAEGYCEDYKVRFCCHDEIEPPPCDGEWTEWINVDDPTVDELGDIETLSRLCDEYEICERPSKIQAVSITSGLPADMTSDVIFSYDVINGFACLNADQDDDLCDNYKVRFCCPEIIECEHWTKWMDKDDSSKTGDWETLPDLEDAFPGTMCDNPVSIDVVTLDGTPADQTGEVFLFMSPTRGFACINDDQPDGVCQDYKVRFCCDDATEKSGECPLVPGYQLETNPKGFCFYKCQTDFDCPGSEKCCPSGSNCGTACMEPVHLCVHDGKQYQYGETRKEDCNTCYCQEDGKWACTIMNCDPIIMKRPIIEEEEVQS
ncbi:mucin-5AC-like [Saccoglossus kowalevskii]|uniref:Uncharacterized protein LOC100367859 n=1 Tax=Saccoglossus kowalevskii TaxID=10224 RepID=A0ABM0GJ06_SACKO|nr:PREDICTED: uncharacterized protein LOC100367859 [Saccoglossus kowalevskii]